jgi:fructokinase
MPIVVCWGELLWDLFPDGPRLGGALANVAYHAAKLGAHAVLVSRVGNDELGRRALSELSKHGVDVSHVQLDDERATGTVRVEIEAGEPRYTIASEAAWDRIGLTPKLAALLPTVDAICYGTLAQRTPLASDELDRALALTRRETVRLCDLNLRPPHVSREVVLRSLSHANGVKLNEHELRRVAEATGAEDPIRHLFESTNISHVALTLGERGAELWTRDAHHVQPPTPIDSTRGDRVGAGDSFVAALALGLTQGLAAEAILARATRYSAFVAEGRGGMPEVPLSVLRELDAIK